MPDAKRTIVFGFLILDADKASRIRKRDIPQHVPLRRTEQAGGMFYQLTEKLVSSKGIPSAQRTRPYESRVRHILMLIKLANSAKIDKRKY